MNINRLLKKIVNRIVNKSQLLLFLKLKYFKKKWRKTNKHNFTIAMNIFDINKVFVGKGTYGELRVKHFGNNDEYLSIGNYCSIASESIFLLGGEHNYKKFSTYPFQNKYGNKQNESIMKGKIIVEDDVWIGYRSTILSGVTLGKGCVVAAGAVVTNDVPPYAIVGGVPAKIIKYRFDNDIRNKIGDIDFSLFSESIIKKILPNLEIEINSENVNDVINNIKREVIK